MFSSLLKLKPRDVPVNVALRNSVCVVLPLALGVATDHVGIGLGIASGAMNTMSQDQPGPYRARMQSMLLTAFAAGLSGFVGGVLGAYSVPMVIAALIWGIGGGMFVAIGPNAGRAGLTCMIMLLILGSTAQPMRSAFSAGLLVFAGGVLQMLFSLAAWPLHRYGPERNVLARVYRELAAVVHRPFNTSRHNLVPPVTQALLDAEQLLHGQFCASGAAMDGFRVLARIIERIRLGLFAIGDVIATLPDHAVNESAQADAGAQARQALLQLRECTARVLDALGDALQRSTDARAASDATEGFKTAQRILEGLSADGDEALQRKLTLALTLAQALGGQLRAAIRNVDLAGSRGELRSEEIEADLPVMLRSSNPFATLRANFHLRSVALRHALRCGACMALAVAGERFLGMPHGFWIPMTAAIVLKPDFAGTFNFGLLRVVGTLAGLLLTSVMVQYAFGNVWVQLVLLGALCMGFRLLTTMNYALGVTMLTGEIVILLSFYGISPGETMFDRGIATVIGSALALVAYVVWPTWERPRLALANMVDAYRIYFRAVFDDDDHARHEARIAARISRTNALASVERLRGEPRAGHKRIALAEGVLANANRFVRACMALEAVLHDNAARPAWAHVNVFVACVNDQLIAIGESLRHEHPVQTQNLRQCERALAGALAGITEGSQRTVAIALGDVCDRLTDSTNTLAYLLNETSD
ncbi:MAG: FUSC family protein [Rhodanobacter sp.]|jgi:uncharacterized membrane protein YccC|nr:FUSC family protein [Rhodanobacter sp.]